MYDIGLSVGEQSIDFGATTERLLIPARSTILQNSRSLLLSVTLADETRKLFCQPIQYHEQVNFLLRTTCPKANAYSKRYNANHAIMLPMHTIYQKPSLEHRKLHAGLEEQNNMKTLGSTREHKSREIQWKARPAVKTLFLLVFFFPFAVWY